MPTYPSEDLYNQQICTSYQKLLQIYNNDLVLNGSGSQIQFLNVTASYVSNNCCLNTSSTYPITSSWAVNTLTSSYTLISNVSHPIKTITNDYNVGLGDYTVLCDASSNTLNVKLPSAASSNTQIFNIKKIDSSGNNIHVTTAAANNIDFNVTQSITSSGTNLSVQSDGTQYWIL